ncbi:MAG TPA: flagellar biosynthesis repressor FlbT [Hyphomicrobiaceae bacterium]|nr:flagellar biosynthesis repressor FlbT [Hyphomicrobiaceae bacterium]
MKKGLRISLRAGERIYVNGAVLRADRKVSLEFLNDVVFLLESHVLQEEETTTPLRQLYFVVQTMLMEPGRADETRKVFESSHALLMAAFENAEVLEGLRRVGELVAAGRVYEALKAIRALFPIEEAILSEGRTPQNPTLEMA